MQIEEQVNGDVTIVKVTGDITLNKGGDVILKDKINSLLQQGRKKLLLDLGGVAYVDSAGLGQLVQVKVTAEPQRGRAEAPEHHQAPEGPAGGDPVVDGVRFLRETKPKGWPASSRPGARLRARALVERARGHGERERGDRGVEAVAAGGYHVIAPLHGAHRAS